MQTSERGIEFGERQEGVVLKAYRDIVGVWTIGAGLTAASGVVRPVAGMTITREQATELMRRALRHNYEPAVNKAMPGAEQHEFDGAVSFHWNTGAIARASWVRAWRRNDPAGIDAGLMKWVRAGGKVVPGLQRRRREESVLIRLGHYGVPLPRKRNIGHAQFSVRLEPENIATLRAGLRKLGYDPGPASDGVSEQAVRRFQGDHDLTVDGIIGPATLNTVQRMLDARTRSAGAGAVTGGGVAAESADFINLPDASGLGWIVAVIGLLWLGWLAFTYRDAIAVKIQTRLPRLAAKLRSF